MSHQYLLANGLLEPAAAVPLQFALDALLSGAFQQLFTFLPSVLAAVLVLVVSLVLGQLLDERVYSLGWSLGIDERIDATPLGAVSDEEDGVADAVATGARYTVYVLGAVVAVGFLDITELQSLVHTVVGYVPDFVAGAVVLLLGFVLARTAGTVAEGLAARQSLLAGFERTHAGRAIDATGDTLSRSVGIAVEYYLYAVTLFVAASVLSIEVFAALMQTVVLYLPAVVGAGFVVVVGALIAEYAGRTVESSASTELVPSGLLGGVAEVVVYVFAAAIALDLLGVSSSLLTVLLVVLVLPVGAAFAIAAGIAVGYGGRSHVKSYLETHRSN